MSNSHKAEGAVGDEEELLATFGQAVQHSICLITTQNVLLCRQIMAIEYRTELEAGKFLREGARVTNAPGAGLGL